MKFSQSDVAKVSWFWAHPESGNIYNFDSSHTVAATDPDGPMAIDVTQFGGEVGVKDFRIFEIAFRGGWVRSMYVPMDGEFSVLIKGRELRETNSMGSQVGLHGPNKEIVQLTLKMLLDGGLQVDHVGMEGHYDEYHFSGKPTEVSNGGAG